MVGDCMHVPQRLWLRSIMLAGAVGLCACSGSAPATPTAAPTAAAIAPTAAPTNTPEPPTAAPTAAPIAAPTAGTIGGVIATPPAGIAAGPRTVLVHLFEWKWTDIAKECENY